MGAAAGPGVSGGPPGAVGVGPGTVRLCATLGGSGGRAGGPEGSLVPFEVCGRIGESAGRLVGSLDGSCGRAGGAAGGEGLVCTGFGVGVGRLPAPPGGCAPPNGSGGLSGPDRRNGPVSSSEGAGASAKYEGRLAGVAWSASFSSPILASGQSVTIQSSSDACP
jgi:hypothetical protein